MQAVWQALSQNSRQALGEHSGCWTKCDPTSVKKENYGSVDYDDLDLVNRDDLDLKNRGDLDQKNVEECGFQNDDFGLERSGHLGLMNCADQEICSLLLINQKNEMA